MVKFSIPRIKVSSQILQLISEIDEFKGRWSLLGQLSSERLQVLRTVATIESVGSSTRIEGSKLTDQEVEKLLSGLSTDSFKSRDEEEVAGYAEAMNILFESYQEIPLTENYIKQFHGILLKFSSKDVHHRGEYKKVSNNVEVFDADGKSIGIVFEAATPFDTPLQMKELIQWTNESFDHHLEHPLLIIALFVLYFLAIHPFQDGNGRLSRILTTLLLLKKGYGYVPYSSLEQIVETQKERYYLALRRSQKQLGKEEEDFEPWILFFLHSLQSQKNRLIEKIDREKKFTKMPQITGEILKIVKEHGSASNAMIQSITHANRNTIKVHLQRMVKEGLLIQHGKGKGTRYTLA